MPLIPKYRTAVVTNISPRWLKERGIRLLMLDFDNTLVPYTTDIPTDPMAFWLKAMLQSHIQICVVSNSRNGRVQKFCRERSIPCITRARKPGTGGIRRCLRQFGCRPEEAALAGDQIFTDTLGGNLAGVTTILVEAIDNHNIWLRLRHVAELPFIYCVNKRRIIHDEH